MSNSDNTAPSKFVRVSAVCVAVYAALVATVMAIIFYGLYGLSDVGTVGTVIGTVCAWISIFVMAFLQGVVTVAVGYVIVKAIVSLTSKPAQ